MVFFIATGISESLTTTQMVLVEAAAFPIILLGRMGLKHLTAVPALRSRALILGTGNRARIVWQVLSGDRLNRLAGFVSHTPHTSSSSTSSDSSSGSLPHPMVPVARVLERDRSLAQIARDHNVDQIVIALDDQRGALPTEELLECRMMGITVHNSGTFLERETGKMDLASMRSSWLIFDEDLSCGRISDICKRSVDLAASVGILVLLAPVLLLTALAIKLDSPRPIFYRQTRVGKGSKPYEIVKFRSMVQDAERNGKAQWAQAGDARVTRIGSILRKSRLDEIPQALNVLSGDMSFVGPRPERPTIITDLTEQIPFYNERHRVKPGIAGWAQINYPYGASVEDARQKLTYDLYYIKNKSLIFDLKAR
jgi:sugar transferase (PEP-CTERM system associated)